MIDDMEMDQFDYDAAVRGFDSIAPTLATTSLDKNPDDGVRALEISKATGVPAPAVMDDLDGYDSQLRSGLTSRIVSDNDVIAEYLRENPLADVVSNDDYGNMDNFARSVPGKSFFDNVITGLEKTPAGRLLIVPAAAGVAGAAKGVVEGLTAPITEKEVAEYERAGPALRYAYGGYDITKRILGALSGGVTGGFMEAAGKFAEEAGTDEAGIDRAKRDALAFVEDWMGRASHIMPERIAEADIARRAGESQALGDVAIAQTEALNKSRLWTESGIEPPVGLAPELDKIKTDVNTAAVEAIYENLDAGLQMLTKERSPELAAAYIKKFYGDHSVGISSERIAELYGDRIPEDGDGILGWVPDLAERLKDALETGTDVQIKLADWIAKVDPQVANELKGDMRVWSGGITINEAAGEVPPKAVVDAPLAQVRAATGTEPMFGFGDRKLTATVIQPDRANITFRTAKGSTYTVNEDGTTTRNKAPRPEHPGEEGLQPASKRTVYMTAEERDKLSILQAKGSGRTTLAFDDKTGHTAVRYVSGEKAGKLIKDTVAKFESQPRVGLYPVEYWGDNYTVHFGNKITELTGPTIQTQQRLQFLNDLGESAGELTVIPEGKQLRIQDITGDLGMHADTIGPSSFVDIAKQLKEMFPEAEELVIGEDVVPIAERLPTAADYNKTKYALSKIHDDKLVSDLVSETGIELDDQAFRDQLDQIKATQAGLSKTSWQKLRKLLIERHERDLEAALARAEKMQKKLQSKEWNTAEKEIKAKVMETLNQRADVLADAFVGSGEIAGKKMKQRYPLRESSLTKEQKAWLPESYYSKDGISPDEIAGMFGYVTGDQLVDSLIKYNQGRGELTAKEHFKNLVNTEVEKVMNWTRGKLDENIMRDAIDQAHSETDVNLVLEEWQGVAMQAGAEVISKEMLKAEAIAAFNRMPSDKVKFNDFQLARLRESQRASDALIAGDTQAALIAFQRRARLTVMAAEAQKFEKLVKRDTKLAKAYGKRFNPDKQRPVVDTHFDLFIRDILRKTERKFGMTDSWLDTEIAESNFNDLNDFVTKTETDHQLEGLELPVPDFLLDRNYRKPVDAMTVEEFTAVHQAIKGLDTIGRAFKKVELVARKESLDAWFTAAEEQIEGKFPALTKSLPRPPLVVDGWSKLWASSTNMETLFGRFDGRDRYGLFTQTFIYPGFEASNFKARRQREVAKMYEGLGKIEDADKLVDHPFKDPKSGKKIEGFTRRNLAVVISNMGNNYNWKVLCDGWGLDPEATWNWVMANARMADFERAAKMAKIFDELFDEASIVYRNIYGVAPEKIQVRPFTATLADGSTKDFGGWYHPIVGDRELSRFVNKLPDVEDGYGFWPSTSNPYVKRRTGAKQVIDLTYESIPRRLDQTIHDIAFREFVADKRNLIKNERFRQLVRAHYGQDYLEQIDDWIMRVAGRGSFVNGAVALANKVSSDLRANVITTQIAFNLGTVEKHGLTAWAMSAREMDANLFKSVPILAKYMAEVTPSMLKYAMYDLFGSSSKLQNNTFKFIRDSSEEIQRREKNVLETIAGQQGMYEKGAGWRWVRSETARYGAKMVAFSDMVSAAPLWLAKYREEFNANGGNHGLSIMVADRAVRRAHGSVAEINMPGIIGGDNPLTPWMTTLYGFMGTSLQRRIEIMHDLNDAHHLGKAGEINEATKYVGRALSGLAIYVVWTGLIEEMISSQFTEDKRGLGEKAVMGLFGMTANAIIGLRDLWKDIEYGSESVGLIGTPIHDLAYVGRDIKKAMKEGKISKELAGKMVQHGITAFGDFTGVGPKHLGTVAHYGIDVFNDYQRPKRIIDIYRGVVSGEQKLKEKR